MADYKDLNDYEVMYLVEENDENAREVLFDKYKPLILKLAYQYQKQAKLYGLEVDDLVQEAYFGLDMAIKTYDVNNNVLFYTYALVMIRSKILNCIRVSSSKKYFLLNQSISLYQSSTDESSLIDTVEDKNALLPHLMVEENEMNDILKQFALTLNFPQACVFELKINGFRNQDICELLEFPVTKINNILFRVRSKLKNYLEDSCLV